MHCLSLAISNELSLHLTTIQASLQALNALPSPQQNAATTSFDQWMAGRTDLDSFDATSAPLARLARMTLGIQGKCPQYGFRLTPAIDPAGDLGLGLLCFDRSAAATLAAGALLLHNAVLSDRFGKGLPKTDDGVFFVNLEGPIDYLDRRKMRRSLRDSWVRTGGYTLQSDDGRRFKAISRDYAQRDRLSEYCGIVGQVVEISPSDPDFYSMLIELKKPLPLMSMEELVNAKNLQNFQGERIAVTIDRDCYLLKQVRRGDYIDVVMEPKVP